jgi:hypothetical protein
MPEDVRAPIVVAPGDVLVGTNAIRQATAPMSPEAIRRASNEEHEDLLPVDYSQAPSNGYLEPVSLGEHPWDLLARTEMESPEQCREIAVAYALNLDALRSDPSWAGAPFLAMDEVGAAYHIELILLKSLGRSSLNEALQGQVGMISPEVISRGRGFGDRVRDFRDRNKPQEWK